MFHKFILFVMLFTAQTCDSQPNKAHSTVSKRLPYDLSKPSETFKIDAPLLEISGLSSTGNDAQLACLNDEKGQLFYINKQTGKVTPALIFQEKGDFESIEFVKDTMWGMTSKGKLVKVWNLEKTPFDVQIFKIESLKTANIEGMGYDNLNHRLLLAAKGDKADGTTVRTVWAFDLEKQTPSVKKVFDVQLIDFQAFLKGKTDKKYAKLSKDYVDTPAANSFEFGPSGIAVHPLTGHIYIVSSVNKVLLILSPEGQIVEMVKLDKTLFPQPEGLCFGADGTLFISNEAKDNSSASLLVFKMQKK